MLPDWTLAPVVAALQTMRGMALVNAATLVAELGDLSRFTNHAISWPISGWCHPSIRAVPASDAAASPSPVRRLLIEAAWCYRFPARISRELLLRQERQPKPIRDIAWKGQVRLCARYRRLVRAGKPANVVTTAIARELAGFVWRSPGRCRRQNDPEKRIIASKGGASEPSDTLSEQGWGRARG